MKRRQGRAAANKPKQRRWAVLSRLFRPHAPAIYTRAASGRRSALLSKARNERRHSGRALVTSFLWWRGISAGWWRRPCFLWRSSSWCINSPTSAAGGWGPAQGQQSGGSSRLFLLRWGAGLVSPDARRLPAVRVRCGCCRCQTASAFSAASLMVTAVCWLTLLWPHWIIACNSGCSECGSNKAALCWLRVRALLCTHFPPGDFFHCFLLLPDFS